MRQEDISAIICADYENKMATVLDGTKTAALDQVLTGAGLLAKHLSAAPAGTTIRDLMKAAARKIKP